MKRMLAVVMMVVVAQAFRPASVAALSDFAGLKPCATLTCPLQVAAIDTVGMTVSDMDRAVAFYMSVLTFEKVSDVEVS